MSNALTAEMIEFGRTVKARIESAFAEVVEGQEGHTSEFGVPYITFVDGVNVPEGHYLTELSNKDQILSRVDDWAKAHRGFQRLVWRKNATPKVEKLDSFGYTGWRIRWRCHVMENAKPIPVNIDPKQKGFFGLIADEPKFKEKVLEDRGSTYGDYRVNMTCVAEFWTSYLKARFGADFTLKPSDVPVMMQLLKEGRIATGKYHPDNQQDIRGYGELYDKLNQEK